MQHVPIRSEPPPRDETRVLAGKAVKDLIAYAGMTPPQAGQVAKNLSIPTVRKIMRGAYVGDASLQAMAGVLHLPVNLFLLIIDGNRAAIERLTMSEYVRDHVLALMSGPGSPSGRRRADHEGIAKG
jgi:hypothetical protein